MHNLYTSYHKVKIKSKYDLRLLYLSDMNYLHVFNLLHVIITFF